MRNHHHTVQVELLHSHDNSFGHGWPKRGGAGSGCTLLGANSQEVVGIIEGCCSDSAPAVARALGLSDSCRPNDMPLMQCRD